MTGEVLDPRVQGVPPGQREIREEKELWGSLELMVVLEIGVILEIKAQLENLERLDNEENKGQWVTQERRGETVLRAKMVNQEYREIQDQKETRDHLGTRGSQDDPGNREYKDKEESQGVMGNLVNRDRRVTMAAQEDLEVRVHVA